MSHAVTGYLISVIILWCSCSVYNVNETDCHEDVFLKLIEIDKILEILLSGSTPSSI